MKNLDRLFDYQFIIGVIKAIFYKVFKGNIHMEGWKYFFGKNTKIISRNGEISLCGKNWIYLNCKLQADGGKIHIGYNTFVNDNAMIISKMSIVIGKDCLIGPGVNIYDHDHNFNNINKRICKQGFSCKEIIIEDDVWIGANVFIAKGVKIGRHSVIAANSVITKNIEEYSLVGGNPAKLIRKLDKFVVE